VAWLSAFCIAQRFLFRGWHGSALSVLGGIAIGIALSVLGLPFCLRSLLNMVTVLLTSMHFAELYIQG
jgi:hypothetical protein